MTKKSKNNVFLGINIKKADLIDELCLSAEKSIIKSTGKLFNKAALSDSEFDYDELSEAIHDETKKIIKNFPVLTEQTTLLCAHCIPANYFASMLFKAVAPLLSDLYKSLSLLTETEKRPSSYQVKQLSKAISNFVFFKAEETIQNGNEIGAVISTPIKVSDFNKIFVKKNSTYFVFFTKEFKVSTFSSLNI